MSDKTDKEKLEEAMKKHGFVDWNKLPMEALVAHLRQTFMYDSSGTAFAVFKLIDFYEQHKDEVS